MCVCGGEEAGLWAVEVAMPCEELAKLMGLWSNMQGLGLRWSAPGANECSSLQTASVVTPSLRLAL